MSSTFDHPLLVRLLAQWAPARPPQGGADLAERLAPWLGAFDAIGLQAAQRAIRAMADGPAGGRSAVQPRALAEAFAQARQTLARAIGLDPVLPNEHGYAAYRRRHLELQRQMEQMVGALREHVRETLAAGPLPLRRLAALDLAMERMVAPREQALLPTGVALLQRRFDQLQAAHRESVRAAGGEDDPAAWRRPGAWLHTFEADWRQVLLAELDLRLHPVAGLVEASGAELNLHP